MKNAQDVQMLTHARRNRARAGGVDGPEVEDGAARRAEGPPAAEDAPADPQDVAA